MATMLPGTLLFATPKCHHCGMLSQSQSTYHGEDFYILLCGSCRDVMDGTVEEIAEDLLSDPKVLQAYQGRTEEERTQEILTLAEDMYFFGRDEENE